MSEVRTQKARPKHLALHLIRLPLPGIVSILHRISGVALFLSLPFLLNLFDYSLLSSEGFNASKEFMAYPLVKLVLFGLIWAFSHHFCAGIRFLLLDIHLGTDLARARASSVAVLVVSLLLTVWAGAKLWL